MFFILLCIENNIKFHLIIALTSKLNQSTNELYSFFLVVSQKLKDLERCDFYHEKNHYSLFHVEKSNTLAPLICDIRYKKEWILSTNWFNFDVDVIFFPSGLKSAWIIVFVCRLWLAWLKKKIFKNQLSTPINKDIHFITRTAYLSVELNAHNLLYLTLLVQQKQLPKESLHIFLFNSQSCEGMFRNARSLSGAYSTIVNFTTHDFLRRATKLSLLNQINVMN